MDFVSDSLGSGRRIRILTILDLWDRSTPALEAERIAFRSTVAQVGNASPAGRMPRRLRTDNGPEFIGRALKRMGAKHGVCPSTAAQGKPTDNGFVESFNGRLRDECLNQHISFPGRSPSIFEKWRLDYNCHRPHGALDWQSPRHTGQPINPQHGQEPLTYLWYREGEGRPLNTLYKG